jgi:RNA polymerase sigma factor (sigma-70 family)
MATLRTFGNGQPVDTSWSPTQNRRSKSAIPGDRVQELSLEGCLPTVEAAVRYVVRRHRLAASDADDLRAEVHVRLLERNVLGAFQHRSELLTYLITTVQRTLFDLRNKSWQKWRPSIEAKRRGPIALLLEQLTVRDGYEFAEACQVLRTNHGVTESEEELAALRDSLPLRTRRRCVGEEAVESLAAPATADTFVLETEQQLLATRLGAALEDALMALPPEDRLVLKMRFYDGVRVSDIARLLVVDQKGLYRRMERLLGQLRSTLAAAGFSEAELAGVLGDSSTEIGPVFDSVVAQRTPGPVRR